MRELENIAERIITNEAATFAIAVADVAASHPSVTKSARLAKTRELLKFAIVKALAECSEKGKMVG